MNLYKSKNGLVTVFLVVFFMSVAAVHAAKGTSKVFIDLLGKYERNLSDSYNSFGGEISIGYQYKMIGFEGFFDILFYKVDFADTTVNYRVYMYGGGIRFQPHRMIFFKGIFGQRGINRSVGSGSNQEESISRYIVYGVGAGILFPITSSLTLVSYGSYIRQHSDPGKNLVAGQLGLGLEI